MSHSCSNQSLVWVTVDRYLAIIYPTTYRLKKNNIIIIYAVSTSLISLVLCINIGFSVKRISETCVLTHRDLRDFDLRVFILPLVLRVCKWIAVLFSETWLWMIVELTVGSILIDLSQKFLLLRTSDFQISSASRASGISFLCLSQYHSAYYVKRSTEL